MKNILQIDLDSDRKEAIIIAKPEPFQKPRNAEEEAAMVIDDMATCCEAICTLIHVADQGGIKKSADSLRDCIKHLEHGFGDASYIGKTV